MPTTPGGLFTLIESDWNDLPVALQLFQVEVEDQVIAGSGGSVSTVFGRSGPAIIAQTGDYTWAQIDKSVSSLADIATRSAGDLNSGTLLAARMPALSGDVTSTAGTASTTIANNAVTLAKMADVATATFLGRNTAGSGDPEVLSIATAKTMLNLSGTNTGDVTLAGENYLSIGAGQVLTANPVNLSGTNVTGILTSNKGGTGVAFFAVAGPTSLRTYTFPDADSTIARTDAGQTFTGTNNFGSLLPSATDTYDLGSSIKLWRKGWLSELDAVLFAKNTISVVGGWMLISKSEGTIPVGQDIGTGDTTIDFGQTMTVNDFVIFRAALQVEYVKVLSLVSGTRYNVTRDLDGTGANAWVAGSVYVVLGNVGNGRIELNANSTPRISVISQGSTYNAQTEMVRLGDLNGSWNVSTETYGFAVGQYGIAGKSSLRIDDSGIHFYNNITERIRLLADGSGYLANTNISWDTAGTLSVQGSVLVEGSVTATALKVGNFENLVEDPGLEKSTTSTTTWTLGSGMTVTTGSPHSGTNYINAVTVNSYAFNNLYVDCKPGDAFYIEGWVASTGGQPGFVCIAWYDETKTLLSISQNSGFAGGFGVYGLTSGVASAPAGAAYARAGFRAGSSTPGWYFDDLYMRRGAVAGWTLNQTTISSGGITLEASATAANNKIFVGTGTYNNTNTGFYVDGSGKMSLKDKFVWDGTDLSIAGALSAAGGDVLVNTSGISITPGTGNVNTIKWVDGGVSVGTILTQFSSGGGGSSQITISSLLKSGQTTGLSRVMLAAANDASEGVQLHLIANGSGSGAADYNWIGIVGISQTFKGVKIGGTVAPDATLDVVGTAWISGAVRMANYGAGTATFDASGNITSVSDERLKTDIIPFRYGLDAIRNINPILYKWKDDSGFDSRSTYPGFSAQNVRKAIPEAVGEGYGLQDRGLIAALVNAVKELEAQIKVLQSAH